MRHATAPERSRPVRALAVVVLLGIAAACGPGEPRPPDPASGSVRSVPVVVQPPVTRPGEALPAPTGTPVLSITGRIAATNADGALVLDLGVLDRLGRLRVSVYEPWIKQELDFQGVWLADLLRAAGADTTARTVHATALDDYQIDLTMADVMAGGILLATRTGDGEPIAVEDGGPTRVVFVGGVPSGSSADQWIWSLSTIDVR